jgi:Divergent InlB B-repeat domain
MVLGCSGGSGGGGGGSTSAGSHSLVIHVSGPGMVQSTAPPISCRGDCQQELAGGGTVLLIASADPGNAFTAWQGDCTGAGACSLTMNGDRSVTAVFSASQPSTFRVTVKPTGSGGGRVTSSPPGIDCPGTCGMSAQLGTSVALNAQPTPDSTFAGWGAACQGNGRCTLTADGDVWADFEKNAPPTQCAGLSIAQPAPISVSVGGPNEPGCGPGMGDSMGTIGLQTNDFVHIGSHATLLHFMDEDSGQQLNWTGHNGSNGSSTRWTPQPQGFIVAYLSGPASGNYLTLESWDTEGRFVRSSQAMWGDMVTRAAPRGGLLVAGKFSWITDTPSRRQAWMFGPDLAVQWTQDLASHGAIFGTGCDPANRCLIVTNGGSGRISSQWLDANGAALTSEFILLDSFQAGPNTWFEAAPWIGGGLAVRRVDQQNDANGVPYRTAQWLVTVGIGQSHAVPAPQWLKGRPNTNLALARGGKAYALLPMGAPDVQCAQRVELVAPDGTSCGSLDATIAAGRCRTEDMTVSLRGTPIQQMPADPTQPPLCSYRWWKDALR